jgi:glycerol-3-phosphate acyltransferase PlsY
MKIVLLVIAAYLLGSIPSAVWIGKRFYGIDVRQYGSHNAGATNTLRVLGKRAALFVFLIDALKGFVAVSLAAFSPYFAGSDPLFNLKIGLLAAAVIGHIFPIFAGFKGGKGVATLTGAMLAVYWPAVLLCLAAFILVLAITKYVSLSSITAGVLLPIFVVFVFGERSESLIITCSVISVLLILTHKKNIGRLINGNESKISFSKRK